MTSRPWLPLVLASAILIAPAVGQAQVTIEWVDAAGNPIAEVHQFATARLRVVNSNYICWGYQMVRVSSDLRGDEGGYSLFESPSCSGIFSTSFPVVATASTAPPQRYDGTLEVTELVGPPFQRDTLRAVLQPCYPEPASCVGDTVPVVGSTVRLTDSAWNDSDLLGFHLYVEVEDHSPSFSPEVTVTTPAGDVEVVALGAGAQPGTHRGTLDVAFAAAVPNDGILQVQEGEVVTASHPDPLGLSSATDTAIAGGARIDVLDRQGAPVSFVLADGDLRLRVHYPVRNVDPGVAEVVVLNVNTRDPWGYFADSETPALYETGPDTGVFAAELPTQSNSFPQQGDWRLQVRGFHPYYTQNDRIELQIYLTPYSSTLEVRGSQLRLIDATGADLEHFLRGDAVHVRVESETQNYSPDTADTMQVLVRATLNGDYESVQLQETGPDTATFEGAITTAAALYAWVGDGLAQVNQDEPLRGEHETVFGTATDEATAGDGNPATLPPVAADDAATTDDGTAVAIDVLSNDSDPEGRALQIVAFTQGTHGSVSGGGLGPLTYTPSASFTGTDTFTYRLRDADGDEDDATVTVTVQLVNQPPDAVDDSYEVDEDVALWFEPLTNDVDPENEGLVIQWATDGAHGTVQAGPDSPWAAYRPSVNFNGSDSFVYRIADPFGAYDVATVHVTVRPVPDPPSVRSDSVTTDEDVPVLIDVLANDSDPDGDALTITAVGTAAGTTPLGQATIENGHVRFVPDANKKGTAWLNYTASDPSGLSASNLVIVTIRSVPDAPVANPDVASTNEEAAVTTAVLANDTDGDGEALTLAAVGQGTHGSVTIDGAQRAVYTPAVDFFGTDTFTYTAADPTGRTATGTVTVTVTNLAEAPDARDDAASTDEDTAVTIAALANDVDADGDTLTITTATQGAHGGVTFAAGSLTYTPAANYHGADSFTYTVDDGTGRTDTANVNVTVGDVNDAPEATDDSASTAEDTAVAIAALANDSDADGGTLAITAVTQGSKGAVTFTSGALTYTPAANANGSDSFSYTIGDGQGGSDSAAVTVTITAVNDAPVAMADSASTAEDTAVTIAASANDNDADGDALAITAVTAGARGTVTFAGGTLTYTPAANANGADSFTYTIADGQGGSGTATVSVTISAVNDSPLAAADTTGTAEDTAVTIDALPNDSDVDGDPLAITAVTQGSRGTVTFTAGGITYTPALNANGSDAFTYTIGDGQGGSATATVAVTITAVNDAPDAIVDGAGTNEDAAVIIAVLGNDFDVDGEPVTLVAVTQGSRGTVAPNGNGTVTYTPSVNNFGADAFTYTIRDAAGLTDTATVAVSVAAVNDPPNAIDDSATLNEGSAVTIAVLSNDVDVDGSLTVTAVGAPAHGTATANANDSITYTPAAGYSGADSFTYTASDGSATDTAMVSVVVKDVIGNVAVLGTHGIWLRSGVDVLSGDVIVNAAGAAPFLTGSVELTIGGSATTAAGWDVEGNRIAVDSGAAVGSDVYSNQLTNNGTISGARYSPLALPVFDALPAFYTAAPGVADVAVANNGTRTLAPGAYRDLIVGRKGTVTFTGGIYHFRSLSIDREAKLLFAAAGEVRVQGKVSTGITTTIGPAAGSGLTAASIVFYVGGINGTGGGVNETPAAVLLGATNTVTANLYAPNGTLWLGDNGVATGTLIARDVRIGINSQVSLSSAW
jgi:hypothetical protein